MPDSQSPHTVAGSNAPTAFDQSYYSTIRWLANTLKTHHFTQKHFNSVRVLMDGIRTTTQDVQSESIRDEHHFTQNTDSKVCLEIKTLIRTLDFFEPRGIYWQPRSVQPALSNYSLTRQKTLLSTESSFTYTDVGHPLFIDVTHVDERRWKHGAWGFKPENLHHLMLMSWAFSGALAQMPGIQDRLTSPQGVRIFLPDPKGLYGCAAQKIPPEDADINMAFSRNRRNRQYQANNVGLALGQPSIRIFVKTFVPGWNLTRDKTRVNEGLQNLFSDPRVEDALVALRLLINTPALPIVPPNPILGRPPVKFSIEQKGRAATQHDIDSSDIEEIVALLGQKDKHLSFLNSRIIEFMGSSVGQWILGENEDRNFCHTLPRAMPIPIQMLFDWNLAEGKATLPAARKTVVTRNVSKSVLPDSNPGVLGLPDLFAGQPTGTDFNRFLYKDGQSPLERMPAAPVRTDKKPSLRQIPSASRR